MATGRDDDELAGMPLFEQARAKERARPAVLRVADLCRLAREVVEGGFADVWVEGELVDVTRATSGHVYFTLRDDEASAQLRGVMFRGDARRAKARFADGERVRLRGGLTFYEARGTVSFVARIALPAGEGDLALALKRLREKLAKEGLFDPSRKRPLPALPRTVGVVTSARGAAIHDVVRVASARGPVRIVLAPCLVQGEDAPASIVKALARLSRLRGLDVVIVGRGGGASEDLSAFNDERVARAIAACPVPTVSAVGHEVDVTIADLVADVRAATPSNAAELVVPDARTLVASIEARQRALERALDARVSRERSRLDRLVRRLGDPGRRLARGRSRVAAAHQELAQRMRRRLGRRRETLVALTARLARQAARSRLARDRARLAMLVARLGQQDARARVARDRARLAALVTRLAPRDARTHLAAARGALEVARARLGSAMHAALQTHRATLATVDGRHAALSPVAVLARGYAIVLDRATGRALLRARDSAAGAAVTIRLAEGSLAARVEAVEDDEK